MDKVGIDKSVTRHRRKLNSEQVEVLELLYKFRFGSNNLFAEYFGKQDRSFVFKRLKILLEQEYIGKRFDSSYRIQGKPAAYYLLPAGARILQGLRPPEKTKEINIKAIYNDKNVKDDFVARCLSLFAIHNRLKAQYGGELKLYTKSGLALYDYFPRPLPDAYIALKAGGKTKRFFLELFKDNEPPFAVNRRLRQLIEYCNEETWQDKGEPFPPILCVCESAGLQKSLTKLIGRAIYKYSEGDDMDFYTTQLSKLMDSTKNDNAVWLNADDPEELLALEDIT